MKLYIADAFTDRIFSGNQAGVVLLNENEGFPEDALMKSIAAELKHSETAFVKRLNDNAFKIRYFTPEAEVELCGHATIALYTVLRSETGIAPGLYKAFTNAGELEVKVEKNLIWLQMPQGKLLKELSAKECEEFYDAYGLTSQACPPGIKPAIIYTGLPDILLPVKSAEYLAGAVQNREKAIEISKKQNVVGLHVFYPELSETVTARCRNFAPNVGIDEESATGTANAALTYYLHKEGLIKENEMNLFIQGESMGKPSKIFSKLENGSIWIGGDAVLSVEGSLRL